MVPTRSLFVVVFAVAALGCSSGDDDGARAGEACSRGTTTAACDACAQTACKQKYAACFHDQRFDLGDRQPAGLCADRATCIAHCGCGDVDCYDACATTVACTGCLSELRDCEAVLCGDDCRAAVAGLDDACTQLARCCASPRMPEGFPFVCRNVAATGRVLDCNAQLAGYHASSYCD